MAWKHNMRIRLPLFVVDFEHRLVE
jgi:hypothetical protein